MNNTVFRRLLKWGTCFARVLPLILWSLPASADQGAGGGGVSILNIIFLGLMAYFLVRAFRRRSGGNDKDRPGRWDRDNTKEPPQGGTPPNRPLDRNDVARQMWEMLGSKPEDNQDRPPVQNSLADFDEAEFLEGAKLFFSRYQQVADKAELDQLHGFLSDGVYQEALGRLQGGEPERTEVMLVEARLVEQKTEGGHTLVSVRYEAQLRRGQSGERSENLSAVWEFSRDNGTGSGLWTLEKINPMNQ